VTPRDRFLAVLGAGPLLRGDAIVVLAGEDAEPRLAVAAELLRTGGAPRVVVTGGKHEPPRWLGAEALRVKLYALGVAPDRVLVESASQHTAEQARAVVALASEHGWARLLLVASAYHLPRAFLTFVRALHDYGGLIRVQLIPVPAAHTPWWGAPAGTTETRLALYERELAKIEAYADDVATYEDGLVYLEHWEGGR